MRRIRELFVSDSSVRKVSAPHHWARYYEVLSRPDVRYPEFWGLIGRMPLFMVNIGMVLFVVSQHGDYARAGLLLALYTLSDATIGIMVGRTVDRFGQALVLVVTGVIYPLTLTGLIFAVVHRSPLAFALAAVAGASIPPISSGIRSLWGSLPLSEAERSTLYAVEAVLFELIAIAGPLLLTVITELASAEVALLTGGALGGLGALGVASTRSCRQWRGSAARRSWLGPLRSPRLAILLCIIPFCSLATGTYTLAIPAFAIQHGNPGATGWLFAVWAAGSTVAGLWYGAREFASAPHRRYIFLLAAFTVGLALPLLAHNLLVLAVTLVIGGAVVAPMTGMEYNLAQKAIPEGMAVEGFTWVLSASIIGNAIGAQAGGLVLSYAGLRWAFAIATSAGLMATVVAIVGRRRLAGL